MSFESNQDTEPDLGMAGEGFGMEEGGTVLPEDAILVESSDTFMRQEGSSPLAERLGLLSSDQYAGLVEEVFKPNGITPGVVESVADESVSDVLPAIIAFVQARNEDDKLTAKAEILSFFGK